MNKKQKKDFDDVQYDQYIMESFSTYLLKCKEVYNRDTIISSKHLLYWIIRKMRKEGVDELDLINYIKECSNEFTEEEEI